MHTQEGSVRTVIVRSSVSAASSDCAPSAVAAGSCAAAEGAGTAALPPKNLPPPPPNPPNHALPPAFAAAAAAASAASSASRERSKSTEAHQSSKPRTMATASRLCCRKVDQQRESYAVQGFKQGTQEYKEPKRYLPRARDGTEPLHDVSAG